MRRRYLQKYDEKSSTYERPNQKWVKDGEVEESCTPRRNGDRWECTRSLGQGGICEVGPDSDGTCCYAFQTAEPVLNLRQRRGQLVRWSIALTIGLLLVLVAGVYGPQFISPGSLTAQHAEISDCAGCHSEEETKPSGWLHAAFASYNEIADSKNCLSCHELGENAFKPHNQKFDQIAEMTARKKKTPNQTSVPVKVALSEALFDVRQTPDGDVTCRTCHLEHQGRKFDLTDVENTCQSCHVSKFTSFAEGHPEFTQYPFERRTRIVFDHTSHADKHFWGKDGNPIAEAPAQCRNCHQTDAAGETMQVVEFEQACSSCHLDQTRGEARSAAKGMSVFILPGLDLETLRDRNIGIGYWPEDADGEITAFTRLLLSDNQKFKEAMTTLKNLDLMDLEEASDAELQAVKAFAWSIKSLINGMVSDGVMGLKDRLGRIAGRELSITEATALSGLMPVDVLRSAQQKWMPGVQKELALFESGQNVPIPATGDDNVEEAPIADHPTSEDQEEIIDDDDIDILSDDDDGDILSDDEDGDILSDDDDDDIITDGDDEISDNDDDSLAGDDEEEDEEETASDDVAPQMSDDEWVAAGGWYQQEFSLDYRSTGHADAFLKSWLDMSARLSREADAKALFADLSRPQALGQCIKCHSVDLEQDGLPVVNWKPFERPGNIHPFTRFSHQPHFSMISEKGCGDCHMVDKKADYLGSYKENDPSTFAGNFDFVNRETCATCHAQEKAPSECATCHNYHVGTFETSVAPTKMMTPKKDN